MCPGCSAGRPRPARLTPLKIIPPIEDPALAPPPAPPGRAPNRVCIADADLRTYGYTAGCPRCMHMRAGLPCRGIKHREACRQRIENYLREANDPRIIAADSRWASRIVAQGDPSVAPNAEEGKASASGGGGSGPEAGPATTGVSAVPGIRAENYEGTQVPATGTSAENSDGGSGPSEPRRGRAGHGR